MLYIFYDSLGITLAIVHKDDEHLIGAIGLLANIQNHHTELGYWIGVPYWKNGYCTEAAKEMMRYAFEDAYYHKITARHIHCNPASGRVVEKAGMKHEDITHLR